MSGWWAINGKGFAMGCMNVVKSDEMVLMGYKTIGLRMNTTDEEF